MIWSFWTDTDIPELRHDVLFSQKIVARRVTQSTLKRFGIAELFHWPLA